MVGVESGNGERGVGIVDEERNSHLNFHKQGRVEVGKLLEYQDLGERGGIHGKRGVDRNMGAVVFVGMGEEMIAFSLGRRRPCIHRKR